LKPKHFAIMTIVVGAGTEAIWEKTQPYFEAYADRIGADLVKMTEIPIVQRPIYENAYSTKVVKYEAAPLYPSAHWLKLALHHWLHKKYRRVLYLDADLIIRPDCPNLFEIVPEAKMGLFNEGDFTPRAMVLHDAKIKMGDLPGWDGFTYYNTGVMVVSRFHRHVFAFPEGPIMPLKFPFGEQTYLNHRIISRKVPVHELPWQMNRMSIMNKWLGVSRLDSYVVHYAGVNNPEATVKTIEKDGERWRADAPAYKYEPCVFIEVGGGLGDQVCAEPALRYLSEHLHPNAEIWALTTWPELFKHLKNVNAFNKTPAIARDAIFEIKTHPTAQTAMRKYVSHLFTHGVDYTSLGILKRTLPNDLKTITLEVDANDREDVSRYEPDMVLHPGRGWPINTFPLVWWNEVISLLSRYYRIAIVGKNVSDEHGVLAVDCPANGYDLRDKLTLGQLLAMLEKTWCLVTNDSAPIHLAGAFDNNIVLIPTCKHPAHLLPWRMGSQYYKARAIYKKLLEDDFPMPVNSIEWTTTGKGKVEDYLPDPGDVARAVMKFGVSAPRRAQTRTLGLGPLTYTASKEMPSSPI